MDNKHYTAVARGLHWGLAALMFFQLALGWRMADLPKGPEAFALFQLHKSIGFSILALVLVRILWRLTHRPPALPAAMPPWEQTFARLGHLGLYGVLLALPLTGWVLVSAGKIQIPTLLFGKLPWPHLPFIAGLPPESRAIWREAAEEIHGALAVLTAALVLGHAAAALKHQLRDKDEVMSHMLPGIAPGANAPRLWIVLAVVLGVGVAGNFWPAGAATPAAPAAPEPLPPMPAEPVAAPALPAPVPAPQAGPGAAAVAPSPPDAAAQPAAPAKAVAWRVDPSSTLGFAATWSGQPVSGRFSRWTGDIRFSPDDLAGSSLTVNVDLASVSTGDAQRDEALPGDDWFDAGHFPKAVFTAARFTHGEGDRYRAEGTLSLRGKTAPVTLDFRLTIKGTQARAEGKTVLDRTVFGVGQGDWSATDQIPAKVDVSFRISARQAG